MTLRRSGEPPGFLWKLGASIEYIIHAAKSERTISNHTRPLSKIYLECAQCHRPPVKCFGSFQIPNRREFKGHEECMNAVAIWPALVTRSKTNVYGLGGQHRFVLKAGVMLKK